MGRKTDFEESLIVNQSTYYQYIDMLKSIRLSLFTYDNVPDYINIREMETYLMDSGRVLLFHDDVIGKFLSLPYVDVSGIDVYGDVGMRKAVSRYNSYHSVVLTGDDSVIMYNNSIKNSDIIAIQNFAKRLYNLDRIVDVNANSQKTPVLITASQSERLSLKNLYKEVDGNAPVIYADKSFNPDSISVLKTDAPFTADKIYELKERIWNEYLTYMGVTNISYQKRERLNVDEVKRGMGGTFAMRNSRLSVRESAIAKFNDIFGCNMTIRFNEPEEIKEGGVIDGEIYNGDQNTLRDSEPEE